ncbi:MAG: hypothetical protein P1U85_19650 [Verrucomicrobiales bacterium]|nr:hypothetical protein [Verrucomicrobiales bacterium]
MTGRKKKTLIIVASALVLLVLASLLTGGLTYGSQQWFGGGRTVPLEDGTEVSLWLNPTQKRWNVPFLAGYFSSKPPYTLQVFVAEPDPSWKVFRITEAIVEYQDGRSEQRTGIAQWQDASRELSLFRGPLAKLVTTHEDCKVTLKGTIVTVDGEATYFSLSHEFEARPRGWGIRPTW